MEQARGRQDSGEDWQGECGEKPCEPGAKAKGQRNQCYPHGQRRSTGSRAKGVVCGQPPRAVADGHAADGPGKEVRHTKSLR